MSGCCRIDPIHHGGIYIPPLIPVLRCLLFSPSFSIPPGAPSRPHRQGGFSRAAAYAATFLGALARDSSLPLPATIPSLQLPQASPLATPRSRRTARRCNGHCLRVKSFHPQAGTIVRSIAMKSGRLHDFCNFRSRAPTMCSRKISYPSATRKSNAIDRRFVRSRFKTPSRSICIYSNEEFPARFASFI